MALYSRVSDIALKKATGKSWEQWVNALDELGAGKMTHKEIAGFLQEKGLINSSWWSQTVTVGYEYAKGRRMVGRSDTQGFEIGLQRTLPFPKDKIWRLMTSKKGVNIWLGRGVDMKFVKDYAFNTEEGITGLIRVVRPGKKLRLTWHPIKWAKPSTLQIYFLETGKDRTSLRFHQEKLPSRKWREIMRKHWMGVTEKLLQMLNTP